MDDNTNTQFLQRLYRTELAGAPSVAAAVREAARDLRGEHPYFWGALRGIRYAGTARMKHARATALATPLKESERLTVTRVPPARNTSAPAAEIDIDQAIDYRLCILRLLDPEPGLTLVACGFRLRLTASRGHAAITRAACLALQRSSLDSGARSGAAVHLDAAPTSPH